MRAIAECAAIALLVRCVATKIIESQLGYSHCVRALYIALLHQTEIGPSKRLSDRAGRIPRGNHPRCIPSRARGFGIELRLRRPKWGQRIDGSGCWIDGKSLQIASPVEIGRIECGKRG